MQRTRRTSPAGFAPNIYLFLNNFVTSFTRRFPTQYFYTHFKEALSVLISVISVFSRVKGREGELMRLQILILFLIFIEWSFLPHTVNSADYRIY